MCDVAANIAKSIDMKHAGTEAFDKLADLLNEIRTHEILKEKKVGVFYLRSTAFLHFHEDADKFYADLHVGEEWERIPVTTLQQRTRFLSRLRGVLKRSMS